MFPSLIHIGEFRLATYGLLVAAGYLLGIWWLGTQRQRMGFSEDRFWGLIYALFFGAILGGKLLYWAVEWDAIVDGRLRPIRDFRYGFVFFGGFLGSVAASALFRRRYRFNYLKAADYFGVALPMGHAIGRLGCFAAGCCYGAPTQMPWGVRFSHPESLVLPHLAHTPLHPTQLYEAVLVGAIAWTAHRLLQRVHAGRLAFGSVFAAYLGLYAASRFLMEFFRGDDRGGALLGLSVSQWIALACLVATAGLFRHLNRKRRAK